MVTQSKRLNLSFRIRHYIKALGRRGQLLTLLGLLPALIDVFAPLFGVAISIPAWVSALSFIVAFSIANFMIFDTSEEDGLEVHIKEHQVSIKKWLSMNEKHYTVNPQVTVVLNLHCALYNPPQNAAYVRIILVSADADWKLSGNPTDTKVLVERAQGYASVNDDKPFSLAPGEIKDVTINVNMMFDVSDSGRGFRCLGSLSYLTVTIGIEQAGKDIIPININCDINQIHESIEEEFKNRIQHTPDLQAQIIPILKEYWKV